MKVYYQGNVVGLSDKVHNMMEMFKENIQFSPNKIIAHQVNICKEKYLYFIGYFGRYPTSIG